ncbi:MAG TPA: protein-glutamate O-methyltransferase [bacterium]|jgi:chemotaxis protein methyltransferase CheR
MSSTPPEILAPVSLSDSDYKKVTQIVHELSGIHLHEGKRELVVARLGKRIRQLGMKSVGDYLKYVREEQTQGELVTMLDALSTNLTAFWRESQHFDYVVKTTLPRLSERARRTEDNKIRVWSAGCSSGEEPYGLTMLMLHHLDRPERYDIRVLATDLSTKVLGIARGATYSSERVKPIPSDIRQKYIQEVRAAYGAQYRVRPEVTAHVTFARLNLMETWPMKGPMDFIFCRNVMIYFDKPTQARLVNRFYDLLRPGGTLFVGHSESLTGVENHFRYVRPTIYEKP